MLVLSLAVDLVSCILGVALDGSVAATDVDTTTCGEVLRLESDMVGIEHGFHMSDEMGYDI